MLGERKKKRRARADPGPGSIPSAQQILALSRAAAHPGFAELGDVRRCQILTNSANILNAMGRFTDAIEGWDAALAIRPDFAMALGNRGYGLKHYGSLLDEDRDRAILLLHAHDAMIEASAPSAYFDSSDSETMSALFAREARSYAMAADVGRIRGFERSALPRQGRSKAERAYRRWCLERRLFVNPLNDLGAHPLAAFDDFVLPPLRERFGARESEVKTGRA